LRYLEKEKSPWELIRLIDADLNEFVDELRLLLQNNLVEIRDGKLKLTKKGWEERENLKVRIYNVRCPNCEGRGIVEDAFGVLSEYKEITKNRPRPTPEYDQGYIKEEDVMRRISFIYERGDLEDANIIVIGDDDLISLGLALTGLPRKIEVLEIDERLIDFINENARKYDLPVNARKYDVREDLEEDLRGKFDVFITDPVETIDGITLFLSRAVSGLRGRGCSGYFGLTHLEASLQKWRVIERRLLDMNFVITDMLRDFNVYPMKDNLEISEKDYLIYRELSSITGSKKIDADFYRSTLIRVEATDIIKPLVRGKVELKDEIYVDDESLVTAKASRR